jgi:heme A synthase
MGKIYDTRRISANGNKFSGRHTPRMMMNKKYMLATLWNWNHRFLGMKLRGVYLAVLILFLA